MIEYLLDTNIVSELVKSPRGDIGQRVRRLPTGKAGVSIISAAEARFGYLKSGSECLRIAVEAVLSAFPLLSLDPPIDQVHAEIREQLRRSGTPIGANDMWIAAHALTLDCTLVTGNEREFRRVPGLRVENWLD